MRKYRHKDSKSLPLSVGSGVRRMMSIISFRDCMMGYPPLCCEMGIMIANPVRESERMNAAADERRVDVEAFTHEEYEDADFEEVMRLSRRIIEQHREAFMALANA